MRLQKEKKGNLQAVGGTQRIHPFSSALSERSCRCCWGYAMDPCILISKKASECYSGEPASSSAHSHLVTSFLNKKSLNSNEPSKFNPFLQYCLFFFYLWSLLRISASFLFFPSDYLRGTSRPISHVTDTVPATCSSHVSDDV